jgi:hypothetical protein
MDGWKDAYLPARAVVLPEVSANLDRLTSGRSDGVGQGIRYHLCRCPTRNPGKRIFACSPGNSGNDRIVRFTVGALLRDDDDDDDEQSVCAGCVVAKQRQRSGLARLFCRCLKRQLGNARIGIGLLVSREPLTMVRPREHMR